MKEKRTERGNKGTYSDERKGVFSYRKALKIAFLGMSILAATGMGGCAAVNKATKQAKEIADRAYDTTQGNLNALMGDGSSHGPSAMPTILGGSAFEPGNEAMYQSNFAEMSSAEFLDQWKTNGSGELVTVDGYSGKWLELSEDSSYKLKRFIHYPDKFTIQFTLLDVAGTSSQVGYIVFGFQRNNVLRGRIPRVRATGIDLNHQYGKIGIWDHGHRRSKQDFNFVDRLNSPYSVDIMVDGQKMIVYVDGNRVAASRLFRPNEQKHFFISGSENYHGQAKVLMKDFRIAKFGSEAENETASR